MTYAIVEASGTQLRVEPGRFYDLDRIVTTDDDDRQPLAEGSTFTLDRVLLISHEGEVTVGQPYIEGAVVEGTVLRHFRGKKVIVYKMRPKKKTRKKRGHRQELTRLAIAAIHLNGTAIALAPEVEDEPLATETTVIEIADFDTLRKH
ncbi:ribosomal protein L21 [Rubidibacter lacunae KORDI 51-2]|uniref:Large ribosomal subunit protein bL21 n=1 Tax=Rubidibacter lacunae KORDI 51-2 TaxID=582515 RepID=U5DQS4_9CHRO|nr:50S ribosomal protein L21 [Rubidibacter lacunae]ERN42030.1 ribosomal protein L21 [Rubidibacter lacunae KORDI 51-2]